MPDLRRDPPVGAQLAAWNLERLEQDGALELGDAAQIEAALRRRLRTGRGRPHGSAEALRKSRLELVGRGRLHDRGDTARVPRHEHWAQWRLERGVAVAEIELVQD